MVKYCNKFHLEFDASKKVFVVIRDKQNSDDKLLRWGFEDYEVMLVSGFISSVCEVFKVHFRQVVRYSLLYRHNYIHGPHRMDMQQVKNYKS